MDIEVSGIAPEPKLIKDKNVTGQSEVLELPDHVIIARPLGKSSAGPDISAEVVRRRQAVRLHIKHLGPQVQHTGQVILEGKVISETGEATRVPILGRMLPKFQKVKAISEIPLAVLLKNSEVSNQIAQANLGYLKMLLIDHVLSDPGLSPNLDHSNPPGLLGKVMRRLRHSNLFVGYDKENNPQVFTDPDWFNPISGKLRHRIRDTVFYSAIFLARYLTYKSAAITTGIKGRLVHQPIPAEATS